ncbi:MAG TPA: cbb3-type cytochrome c oxidase subunit II [Verrucomicrobiae bacterium]
MKSGFRVFLAAFLALGLSWCGFVLAPVNQLGTARQAAVLNSSDLYPLQRTGEATLGLQVYRANGCAACHTEQVRQDGVMCEVVLTDLGKNGAAISNALVGIEELMHKENPENEHIGVSSEKIYHKVSKTIADSISDEIAAAGGKTEIHIVPVGVDIARGWGVRRSVAADFLYDAPVQLGSLRAGPDLANIGLRYPDLNWQLVHLYAPQAVVKNSAMPAFRYLFELRKHIDGVSSPDALKLPQAFAPPAGYEVVPTPEGRQLAAYLLSLKTDAPLYEAPFTSVMTKP